MAPPGIIDQTPSTEEAQRSVLSELNSRLNVPSGAKLDALGASSPLPTFDLQPFLAGGNSSELFLQEECKALADCLSRTGCLIVRDPRVASEDNAHFLDLMERYFGQASEVKFRDARPELHYQVCCCGNEQPSSTLHEGI